MLTTIQEILTLRLNECAQAIRTAIKTTGRQASGRTAASIRVDVADGTGTIYGRRAFFTLEHGRKPGKVPKGFVGMIRQWIIDKGIKTTPKNYIRRASEKWQPKYTPAERGLNAAAGAIAYRIRTEGTSLYRHGAQNDVYTPAINKAVADIKKDIAGLYREKILEDIRNFNRN